MSEEDQDKYEVAKRNPYRDDPVWEDWHSQAYGVQGGADDSSSSDSEDETADTEAVTLPTSCICQHCRLVARRKKVGGGWGSRDDCII
jgi:hypothetical protein